MTDAKRQQILDLKHVMSSPEGRRFVWRFLSEARIFAPCYTGNGHTNYNEGRREFGLAYFADTQQPEVFELYLQMARENKDVETTKPQGDTNDGE